MILAGVEINAMDAMGYTPLHISIEAGCIDTSAILLKNGANPNITSHKVSNCLSPIYLASKKELVRLLLENGADPYLMVENSSQNNNTPHSTLLQKLLKAQPKGIEELFNDSVMSNGKSLDSEELLVVLDFKHFWHEGSIQKQDPSKPKPHEEAHIREPTDDESSENCDEMALHKKLVKLKFECVLSHPLSESFLHLKWQLTRPLLFLNMIMYGVFLIFLTSLILYETYLIRCSSYKSENKSVSTCMTSEFPKCICSRICPDVPEEDIKEQDFLEERDCYWKWELKPNIEFGHFMDCHSEDQKIKEYALLVMSIIGWWMLLLRELSQLINSWRSYFKDKENWIECALLIFSGLYMGLLFRYNVNRAIIHHLGSWSLFFAWIDVTLLIGRFPSIGTTIHMCFQVVKSVLFLFVIFFPVILAFAFSFHVLLISNVQFENSWFSIMKILTMMAGEFDYYDNFSLDATADDNAHGTNQILFLLAFGLTTIIIMNLLIGLTVSKVDELKEQADMFRLEKTVSLVASAHTFLRRSSNLISRIISKKTRDKIINRGKIFPLIKSIIQLSRDSLSKGQINNHEFLSVTKVCFKPNCRNFPPYTEEMHKTKFEFHSWPLYLFNKETLREGEKIPKLTLPPTIIYKLVNILKVKEENKLMPNLRYLEDESYNSPNSNFEINTSHL